MSAQAQGRWGILLDSGKVHDFGWCSRDEAIARRDDWRSARRQALAERSIVTPRIVLGLVRYKGKGPPAARPRKRQRR